MFPDGKGNLGNVVKGRPSRLLLTFYIFLDAVCEEGVETREPTPLHRRRPSACGHDCVQCEQVVMDDLT
jgi:hypothetical protein